MNTAGEDSFLSVRRISENVAVHENRVSTETPGLHVEGKFFNKGKSELCAPRRRENRHGRYRSERADRWMSQRAFALSLQFLSVSLSLLFVDTFQRISTSLL